MKKITGAGVIILSLLLSACGGTPVAPAMEAQDIQSTAVAAAFTIVAETESAKPTNTSVPPTETPPPPSDTPAPSPTAMDLLSPTAVPTFTVEPVSSAPTTDPCNKALTAWQGPSANFNIVYEYTPRSKDDKVVVSLWVMTDQGECGFLSNLSSGPVGQYSAAAYVDGKKDFKVFGGFRITEASWDIVIRNSTIVALGGCYPNC